LVLDTHPDSNTRKTVAYTHKKLKGFRARFSTQGPNAGLFANRRSGFRVIALGYFRFPAFTAGFIVDCLMKLVLEFNTAKSSAPKTVCLFLMPVLSDCSYYCEWYCFNTLL
jgi:hypothetical protein